MSLCFITNIFVPGKVKCSQTSGESRYPRRDRLVTNYTEIDGLEDDDYLRMYKLYLSVLYVMLTIIIISHTHAMMILNSGKSEAALAQVISMEMPLRHL